jgi:hypothetical protein
MVESNGKQPNPEHKDPQSQENLNESRIHHPAHGIELGENQNFPPKKEQGRKAGKKHYLGELAGK